MLITITTRGTTAAGVFKPTFEHITNDEGLSHLTVYSILRDTEGLMWFGTEDGLNRYDGYRFTIFQHSPFGTNSLSINNISDLIQDRTGIIWIGTWGGGLNRFDPATGQVHAFRHDPKDPTSLSHDRAQTVFEDANGTIWIGTAGGGVNKLVHPPGQAFDPSAVTFRHYTHDPENLNSLSHDRIWKIVQDQQGLLWIATDDGLNRFNPKVESFTRFYHEPDQPGSLTHSRVRTVYASRSGTIWAGTQYGLNRWNDSTQSWDHYIDTVQTGGSISHHTINTIVEDHTGSMWIGTQNGLITDLDLDTGAYELYQNDPNDPASLSNNDIRAILEDQSHMLWIATRRGGLNKLDLKPRKFLHYTYDPENPESLNDNIIWAIHRDRAGVLWVGTDDGGLNRLESPLIDWRSEQKHRYFSQDRETFTHYRHQAGVPGSISHNRVTAIHEDRKERLWVGTDGGGLNLLDQATEQFSVFQHDPNDPTSLSDNSILEIFEDSNGHLWLGTDGGGLNHFEPEQKTCIVYRHDPLNPESISDNIVWTILESPDGGFWIGTGNGLNFFDPVSKKFTCFKNKPDDRDSLSNDDVRALYLSEKGDLWIGTLGGGLNRFDPETGSFTYYTEKHGLPNNVIYAIHEDESGHLWLSTNKGLSRFDPSTGFAQNYDVSDGLQSNTFNQGADFKASNGEMYFGGVNGFNRFRPDQIQANAHVPPVIITGFKVFDQPVASAEPIRNGDTIDLTYQQNFFSFEFAALDYTDPSKNRYAYKLDDFDRNWIYSDSRRFASYTNLPPGEYTFRVRGSNNDRVWNENGVRVHILVSPPFWRTPGFITGVLVVVLVGLIAFNRYQEQRFQQKIDLKRKSNELEYAREIQLSLLPETNLDLREMEAVGRMVTATEVGGDYFDLIELEPVSDMGGRYCIAIGDVTGHGVAAGFVVGMVKMAFIAALKNFQRDASIVTLLSNLNSALRNTLTQRHMGMGFGVGLLEFDPPHIEVSTTGIPFPYFFSKATGKLETLEMEGPPIGLIAEIQLQAIKRNFEPGDMLILLTDGFAERFRSGKQMWGYDAVEESLHRHCQHAACAEDVIRGVINDCNQFAGSTVANDDMTMVVVRRKVR